MFGSSKEYRACVNAINAMLTYSRLPADRKGQVDLKARMLYVTGGRSIESGEVLIQAADAKKSFAKFSVFETFSLYSMAMAELFIQLGNQNESWDPPKNPFSLRPTQKDIDKASKYFSDKYGINVTIFPQPCCGSKVRFHQSETPRGGKVVGAFIFKASECETAISEYLSQLPHLDRTKADHILFWLMARNESITEPVAIPNVWYNLQFVVGSLIRKTNYHVYCSECEKYFTGLSFEKIERLNGFDYHVRCPKRHLLFVEEGPIIN